MAKLRDGRVLAATAASSGGLTSVAELYDPVTGQWTPTGSVNNLRWGFSNLVALPDGRALITGGHDPNVNDYASTELYDPATGQWTSTGSLNTPRRHPVVIGLADGRVLAATGARGAPDGGRFLSSAEIYDPGTATWTPTGSTTVPRESADGILMHDGRVMIVGGYNCCDTLQATTDLFNPSTGTWSRGGNRPRAGGGMALTNLPDGRVLSVGGSYQPNGPSAEAAVFDPSTNQWTTIAPPQFARSGADAVVLPNGTVLVAGGGPAQSELFDPATNSWSVGPALNVPRAGGQLLLLDSGEVMMAAGYRSADNQPTTATELYSNETEPPDTTAPDVAPTVTGTLGTGGWYTSDVSVTWTITDGESPITSTSGCDPATIAVDTSSTTLTCSATSAGGTTTDSVTVQRDATAPTLDISGGPGEATTYLFGSVPAAPLCTATDATSGPATQPCAAQGYSAAVGTHTMTFSATDRAGNTATATRSYSVEPWTLSGFYQPTDMGGVVNTVKGGSTVPLKFEVFSGATELSDLSVVRATFTVSATSCSGGATDDVELVTTGATALRYDLAAGQFIQNWKTPKAPGSCYTVTLTTADGSALTAKFKLR